MALLTAIFVVALATIAATALVTTNAISLRRFGNLQDTEQALWYAEGVESWVRLVLANQGQEHPQVDSLGDPWAQPIASLPIDHGQVSGRIEDLQGRFNLNNLGALNPQPYYDEFQRLLANIPGVDAAVASQLGPNIRAWLGGAAAPGSSASIDDDGIYMSLDPPYRSAHQLMRSPSELLAIQGVTPKLYEAIRPYVATLPTTSSKINLNTAPLPVLMSLSSKPGPGIQAFVEERVKTPLQSIADAQKRNLFDPDPKDNVSSLVDVRSSFFQLRAEIAVGSSRLLFFSTISRQSGGGEPFIIGHSTSTD